MLGWLWTTGIFDLFSWCFDGLVVNRSGCSPRLRDWQRLAKGRHRLAGVPEGPCGIPELKKFQAALPGYQIKVMSIDPPHMIINVGPVASDKMILLIKEDGNYNGCNPFKEFLSKSYFCHECNRGFNTDDMEHHPSDGTWRGSCYRRDCPDFKAAKQPLKPGHFPKPSSLCTLCHRKFFGDDCFHHHLYRRSKTIFFHLHTLPLIPRVL